MEGLIAIVAALLCSVPIPAFSAGGAVSYSYDALGRLKWVTYPNGVTVTYALDAAGNRTSVTTTQPPSAPGTPTISSIAASTATATWTASSGSPSGYEYTLDGGASWLSVGAALSTNLSGLTINGAQYTFSVRAYDAEGGRGSESSATFSTAPSSPGAVTITNIGGTTATASWGAATDSGGVAGYEYSLNGGGSWTSVGNTLTTNLTGLTSAAGYTFSVRAYDGAGTRGGSSSSPFTTLDTVPPSAPGTPVLSNETTSSATAQWSAASDNVGVTGYEYSLNGGSSWANVGNTLTTSLAGLAGATQYTFSVRAYDAAGNRGASASSSFATAPGTPQFTNWEQWGCNGSYKLFWGAVSGATSYNLYVQSSTGGPSYAYWGSTSNTTQVVKVPNGITQHFEVQACTGTSCGGDSSSTGALTYFSGCP